MSEQLSMGVLRNAETETFVVVTLDLASAQYIKSIAFLIEQQFRDAFKQLSEPDLSP